MQKISNARRLFNCISFNHIIAIFVALILLSPAGLLMPSSVMAEGGTFPASPFNGMSITYSISGATITESKDSEGFTVSRALKGTLGSGQLTLSGTVSQASGYGADASARVWVGNDSKEFTATLVTPKSGADSKSFNLAVNIPKGATSGGFSIDMSGDYNAGSRGLIVSGSFGGSAPSTPSVSTPTVVPGSQAPGPRVDKLPDPEGEPVGFVKEVNGTVYVSAGPSELPPSQQKWTVAKVGQKLGDGWSIRTAPGSDAGLLWGTGAFVRTKPSSWFEFKPLTTAQTPQSVAYGRLFEGISNFYIQKNQDAAKKFEVETERAIVGIKGTNFVLEESGSQTLLKVIEGTVDLTSKKSGQTTSVTTGQQIAVTDSGLGSASAFDAAAEQAKWGDMSLPDSNSSDTSSNPKKQVTISLPKCPITAALAVEPTSPKLTIFRNFRDKVLSKSVAGKWFVDRYYQFGPWIVANLLNSDLSRSVAKVSIVEPFSMALNSSSFIWNN
jgi:hypothetical protein